MDTCQNSKAFHTEDRDSNWTCKALTRIISYLSGMGPSIFSIIARCSRLSWVWNSVNPRYNSNIMHPIDQTSQGWDHPSSKKQFRFWWNFFLKTWCLKITKKSHSTLQAKRAMFTFWVDKSSLKMPKMVNFGDFLKTWNLRSNSVTRQVTFNGTKIGEKRQNYRIHPMRHFWIIFKTLCDSKKLKVN